MELAGSKRNTAIAAPQRHLSADPNKLSTARVTQHGPIDFSTCTTLHSHSHEPNPCHRPLSPDRTPVVRGAAMTSKREYDDVGDDLDDGEISEPSPKRPRKQTGAAPRHHHQNSSIDPTWGQKYVFADHHGATTIPYGEEDEFEDDADAMAYLSSVRNEASAIPHLLVAPKVQIGPQLPPELQDHDDGEVSEHSAYEEDPSAYYDDGAYIALPDDDGDAPDELNEAYFAAILRRYRLLRAALHSNLPATAAGRLLPSQLTFAAPLGRHSSTVKKWSDVLRHTDPHPVQLALMSKETTMRVLRVLLGGTFLRRGHALAERTSQWLWGLLARLPDAGELNHVEIAWIRDLGRRAVLLSTSLAEMAALREQLADQGLGVHDGVDDSSSDEDVVATDEDDTQRRDAVNAHVQVDGEVPVHEEAPVNDEVQLDGDATAHDEAPEDGEVPVHDEAPVDGTDEEGEAAMDLDSEDDEKDLEAAKKALLAKLDTGDANEDELREEGRTRQLMNMRATINMILTVAGEFYGQRDLLEFREPFVGL